MPCRPAVTSRNVKPRLAQMLDTATDISAVPGSRSRPGDLITGKRSASQPMFDSTPMSGCSRNSHIRLATATDVAIVDVKMKRKTARPRRNLSASTARRDAEHEADRHGQQGELDGDPEGVEELVAAGDVDVLVPPVGDAVLALRVAAHVPEPDRLDQRVDDEEPEDDGRRGDHQQPDGQVAPAAPSTSRPRPDSRRRPPDGRGARCLAIRVPASECCMEHHAHRHTPMARTARTVGH